MATSTKPYLLRALYEWCTDNGYTPYLVAWVNEYTRVPVEYVQDNQIVLNINASAVKDLLMDNEWISFSARFGGVAHEVVIPIGHVESLFAKETNEGMAFEMQEWQPENTSVPSTSKKTLKLVK